VAAAFSVMGFSFTGAAPNAGMIFTRLKDYAERLRSDQSLAAVMGRLSGQLFAIPGAIVVTFPPPAIQGLGFFGGFQFEVLDQTGNEDVGALAQATFGLIGQGNQSGQVQGLFSTFRADDPQLIVDIDRDRARSLGLPLREVTDALQVFLGSQYVNDFDFNNRAYRVYVQADQRYRASPADLRQLYARSSSGDMVPLSSVVRLRETTAPQVISHFNLFRSASITGNPAPGQSSGQALQAMERLARQSLPQGFDFAWAGQSLEEIKSGQQAGAIFGLSVILVYLVLAAQYESWVLPFIILLGVPLAVFGALAAQMLRGFNNDVFCQVGLVLLIGLAAKNSILIVEFAEQLRERGRSIVDAAVEAARIRLRPILMTSLAFILGVLPLALATGAGAGARNSVGTTVAGGMLASTFLSIVFIPVLYVVIRSLVPGRGRRAHDAPEAAGGGPAPVVAALVLGVALGSPALAASPHAQGPPPGQPAMETLTFDQAIARAIERNPTVAIAAANIVRSEGILQQVRSLTLPRVGGRFANTTLDTGLEFSDQTVQPRNQSLFGATVAAPILAAAQWAARAQAMDQVEIARLSVTDVRRQIAVAAASAYLAIVTQKRQVEVSERALETARAQFDYNRRRREGGVGSRLNELRASQVVATDEALVETFRLNVRRAQEALGVVLGASAPIDAAAEPAFETPADASEPDWMAARPDIRLLTAEQRAADRVVRDSTKDWWPTAGVSFDPQYLTPSGIFQPSRTWRLTFLANQPIYDGGERRGVRRQREADLEAAAKSLERAAIQARAEVRTAHAAVEAYRRSLQSARLAAEQASEVLKITIVAFDAGASTNIEVIDAQRSARDLETAVAQVEDNLRQAQLDLLVALGQFPK
jgi:outer membrane protein TolC